MKKNLKSTRYCLLMLSLVGLLIASCGKDNSQINYGSNLIYMPQAAQAVNAGNSAYNIPGNQTDPRTYNFTRNGANIEIFLGVYLSGKIVDNPFGVDITTKPDTINTLISSGGLGSQVILMPSNIFVLPSHIDVYKGQNEANFKLSIDTGTLRSYTGQNLAVAVNIANPTVYKLNATLCTTIILLNVNSVFALLK